MSKDKVYWVVSEVNQKNAGYRVRVLPIATALEKHSIKPIIISSREFIETIQNIASNAKVVIIAKPSEPEILLCIKYLRSHNVRVLADFFDNYFSWSSALYKRAVSWQWLTTIKASSGVFVSTSYIADTFRQLGLAEVCVVSDPPPEKLPVISDSGNMGLGIKWHKLEKLEILWFGISSNPYFNAGIDDLISWGRVVSYINDRLCKKLDIRLTLCTNRVEGVDAALIYFNNSGITTRFVEWEESVCDNLLENSHLVLIPSNLSRFSLSKTHNRCSDALKHQCLVLSSPNGPYHDIPGAVYRDIQQLCTDLAQLDLAHIATLINQSREYLSQTYALSMQAYNLAKLILKEDNQTNSLAVPTSTIPPILLVGSGTSAVVVKLSRKMGYLSASARDFDFKLNFDFILTELNANDGSITLEINGAAKKGINAILKQRLNDDSYEHTVEPTVIDIQDNNGHLTVMLHLPDCLAEIKAIEALRALAGNHVSLRERLYELNTIIIIVALRKLGFNQFEYSGTDSVGWESYIAHANPDLNESVIKLKKLWMNHQLKEQDISTQSRPVYAEGVCNA